MSQTTSLELPNKSFESLLTILNNINDNIAEIGTCLSDAFDTSRVKNFGESLNTVVGIFASIIGIIGTFYGNMQMLNEFGAAFSSINGAASGMGASIASACALSIPEIALVAAAIAAISGAALICQDEIKASCTQTLGWIDNDFLSPLAEGISEITGWLWEAHIKPLWDNMKSFTNSLREMANAIWNNFFGPIVHWLSDTFCPVFSIAIEIIVDVIGTIIGVIVDLFNGIVKFFEGIINFITGVFTLDAQKAFEGVWKMIEGCIIFFGGLVKGMCNLLVDAVNFVINAIFQLFRIIANTYGGIIKAVGALFGKEWGWSIPNYAPKIPKLADGGYPSSGQMFIAREAGPELVGTIGSRSAVVNNDQIVESVSAGVYRAVKAAMGQNGGGVIQLILDGTKVAEVVSDNVNAITRRTGRCPILV